MSRVEEIVEGKRIEADFSDSDFLVARLSGQARLSEVRKQHAASRQEDSSAQRVQAEEQPEPVAESPGKPWRVIAASLLPLIPFVLLVWYLLARR